MDAHCCHRTRTVLVRERVDCRRAHTAILHVRPCMNQHTASVKLAAAAGSASLALLCCSDSANSVVRCDLGVTTSDGSDILWPMSCADTFQLCHIRSSLAFSSGQPVAHTLCCWQAGVPYQS